MCGCSKQTREGHGVRYFGAFASSFVSAVEFSVENFRKKSIRQREMLLEKKWRAKTKPETSREDDEEQRGQLRSTSCRGVPALVGSQQNNRGVLNLPCFLLHLDFYTQQPPTAFRCLSLLSVISLKQNRFCYSE